LLPKKGSVPSFFELAAIMYPIGETRANISKDAVRANELFSSAGAKNGCARSHWVLGMYYSNNPSSDSLLYFTLFAAQEYMSHLKTQAWFFVPR
jgi:hypothetical protein